MFTPTMHTQKFVIVICLFLFSCTTELTPVPLPHHTVPVVDGQSILIRLNEGEIMIVGDEREQVDVTGQALFPDQTDYQVESSKDLIQIVAAHTSGHSSGLPIRLEVYVPNGTSLKVESEFASVVVRDYTGELEVASVAGDISVEDVSGVLVARSNRGDVSILNSNGNISVVGNYGLLTLANVHGDTGVSTIMGTIQFNGLIQAEDLVRLETDHGPVAVDLSEDSALNLHVRSNSGDVACLLSGINTSLRTCDGVVNSGGGSLNIRTVSGSVKIQWIP